MKGNRAMLEEMFIKAWSETTEVMPTAKLEENLWAADLAMFKPVIVKSKKAKITLAAPNKPSSSATMAKIESVVTSGRN